MLNMFALLNLHVFCCSCVQLFSVVLAWLMSYTENIFLIWWKQNKLLFIGGAEVVVRERY